MIDLGVMRDWSYYSGVVIEAYAPGVAAPVAVGGRYDGLGARFGRPRSAVGVAVTLELLHHAVGGPEGIEPVGVVVVGGLDDRVTAAAMLRATGVPVVAVPLKQRDVDTFAVADGRRYVLVAIANHPDAGAIRPVVDALVTWTARPAATATSAPLPPEAPPSRRRAP
jgi:ATP phosphoribosyltransferase regulatory subunit